jgi:hypothetical protein
MDGLGNFELELTDYGRRILARDETSEWAEATLRRACQEFNIGEPQAIVIEQTAPWAFEARAFIPRR